MNDALTIERLYDLRLGAMAEAFAEEAIHGSLARASSEGIAQSLRSELEKAVDDEDYEKAAAIRDKLKELES